MKKRLTAMILAMVLGAGVLAGCGGAAKQESTPAAGTEETAEAAGAAETRSIKVTWVHYSGVPADMQEVTDAVNAITVPEIGVEVEFVPMSLGDTMTKYTTMIASNERMDLMLLLFQDPLQYYSNGSLEPLNDLMSQYGTTIQGLSEQFPILAVSAEGETYGVAPVDQYYGMQGALFLQGEYVDDVTLNEDPDHIYTMEELTDILAQLKEAHPEMYPYNVPGNGVNASNFPFGFMGGIAYDNCGSGAHSGVLLGCESTEIVNLFETEEYHSYLQTLKSWYDSGYILPDAVTTDSSAQDLINSGVTMTLSGTCNPIVLADQVSNMGEGTVALKTTAPYYQSTAAGLVTWTISVTAQEPEAAMQFLDLVYSNADLMNLIQWGIEGKHFVKTEEEGIIAFPEGVDGSNSGYYNTFGVWGDRRNQYVWDPLAGRENNEVFTEQAQANPTKAGIANYRYDPTAMTNEIAAVDTVLNQYLPALECGSASDLEKTYAEFLAALKSAGIDRIIADNQAQFDAYLEANGIEK